MLRLLDSLSLPGDRDKPNEDFFGHDEARAVVFDGATMLGDPVMPGSSDAAWIARFGTRRLLAHLQDQAPKKALKLAMADTEKSFNALRLRELEAPWQLPCASLMLVAATQASEGRSALEFMWLGDCGALVAEDGKLAVVGETMERRARESAGAARLAKAKNLSPVGGRASFLGPLRAARGHVNSGSYWLFTPDKRAAAHARAKRMRVGPGAVLLIASDGFLALASDYDAYDGAGLLAAAKSKGLAALGDEMRAIENADAGGDKFPRFKKSDDATALLLEVA